MESSRDSSIWRNLAVTFGGGLALGAVGMKLTQTALRPADAVPRPESNKLTGRMETVERRLERMEHAPTSPRPTPVAQTAAVPIDQKVLEAVIGAVDARLHENAGQMERRLADLEARITVEMQALHHQDRQTAEANEKARAEVQRQFRKEADALRAALEQDLRQVGNSVSQAIAGQTSINAELQALRAQNERLMDAAEQRFADMRFEYRQAMAEVRDSVSQTMAASKAAHEQQVAELRAALDQSVEARIVTAAAAAVATQMDDRLAPLRAEVRQKERELVELRQRLADSESSVLDVVSSIGEVCRRAAERMNRQPAPPTAAPPAQPDGPPVAPEAIAPPLQAATEEPALSAADAAPAPAPEPAVETLAMPELVADPSLAQAIPDFLRETNRKVNWRIPLVSALLVSATTGGLLLLHYL